jgi:signal transduction histidine kinase
MVLVNDTGRDPQRVEVVVMKETSREKGDELKVLIAKAGPVYDRLAVKKLPLSQFDIEFDPRYRALEAMERGFFKDLQMSAYAPIVVENVLIGILMCGPRLNDAPFTNRDLELLATMADQTGVALRNSRAMADLRHLNATMKALNADLEEANKQFEKLDAVKTDFITIASHELRTPLAQIRGYTDILDALNEQGMLDQDQITGMVSNLRKASERTEELIAAMLDMSQLDVNAMDLRFAQAAPESILRMAIEPLTEPATSAVAANAVRWPILRPGRGSILP